MKQHILLLCLALLLVMSLVLSPAIAAASVGKTTQVAGTSQISPGNYCISCHLAEDPRLLTVTQWKGTLVRQVNTPCPAAVQIHKQLYYTERMLLMIERGQETSSPLPEKAQLQFEGYAQTYSRQLDQPVTSLEAFSTEAQTTRYRLNKIYTVVNQMVQNDKRRTVLLYAAAISVIVLASLIWGLVNIRLYQGGIGRKRTVTLAAVAFILLVIGLFTLPIFRLPTAELVASTAEQQDAQATRDTADRAAMAADRAQARAWMLARLAAEWNKHDPLQAQSLLQESLSGIQQVNENQDALWGQSLAVQEAGTGTDIQVEKGVLVALDLNAARARIWSIPLIAVQWSAVNPQEAVSLLHAEQRVAESGTGIYRDLQLRSVALAWAFTSPWQAAPTAIKIVDPSIRSWTQREIAVLTRQPEVFETAASSARLIEDPVQRARSLRELALASGNDTLFDEAHAALDGVEGAALVYALSDLAAASENPDLLKEIPTGYSDAAVYALLRLGEYEAAWTESNLILDPIDRSRAQAAIAAAAQDAQMAMQIKEPLYRDMALRDIIRKTGNEALTDSIGSGYYRIQALTALGDYEAAIQEAGTLSDAYPLVELALKLVDSNPQAALRLVDRMSREADKAIVLRAVAVATGDQDFFEQALGMALAARVSGDPLAPAQASLDLADVLWAIDPVNARTALQQACEAARKIAIK